MSEARSMKNICADLRRNQNTWLKRLLVLAIFSLVFLMCVANPIAKYLTSSTFDSETARVAQFVVSPTGVTTDKDFELDDTNTTATYTFTVTNDKGGTTINEVATAYDVELNLPKEFKGITPTLKNATDEIAGTASADGLTYTFTNAGSFEAATSKTDTLTFTFTMDKDTAEDGVWDNIGVTVKAAQTF